MIMFQIYSVLVLLTWVLVDDYIKGLDMKRQASRVSYLRVTHARFAGVLSINKTWIKG